eukprot:GHVS01013839.1.p1 GENE.GHVS01013839.1~~GHVS01013839.1.p1  ORF type:complete len:103 (-),score=2.38 GHVS01013839.1:231-539(-)
MLSASYHQYTSNRSLSQLVLHVEALAVGLASSSRVLQSPPLLFLIEGVSSSLSGSALLVDEKAWKLELRENLVLPRIEKFPYARLSKYLHGQMDIFIHVSLF